VAQANWLVAVTKRLKLPRILSDLPMQRLVVKRLTCRAGRKESH
jgi:hypothetical protein